MIKELKNKYTIDSIWELKNIVEDIKAFYNFTIEEEEYTLILRDKKHTYCIDFNKVDDKHILIKEVYEVFKELPLSKNYHN